MRQGLELSQLATQLVDIRKNSRDFMVPVELMKMGIHGGLEFQDNTMMPNNWANRQISTYTDIPARYYNRLEHENKELLATNVNYGFRRKVNADKGQTRLIRAYKNDVRAFVSNRFRRLDNADFVETVYPVLQSLDMTVVSSNLNSQKLYVKATTPRLKADIGLNDVVQFGLVLSNSDVGDGSVRIEFLLYRLVCLNGMIAGTGMKKMHIGRANDCDGVTELLSDETLKLNDEAFWKTTKEVIERTADPANFASLVESMKDAKESQIHRKPSEVVELSMKHFGLKDDTLKDDLLTSLASGNQGAGLNKWGLAQSYSAVAKNGNLSYEQATDLERLSSKVISLNENEWKRIAV